MVLFENIKSNGGTESICLFAEKSGLKVQSAILLSEAAELVNKAVA